MWLGGGGAAYRTLHIRLACIALSRLEMGELCVFLEVFKLTWFLVSLARKALHILPCWRMAQ